MDIKRKLVATAIGALALGGIGTGTAIAASGDPSQPAPASQEQVGPDQDNVDFTPANEVGQPEPAESTEADEAQEGPEKAEAPEADGTNHEDPDGVDVEYTPAGEAPEAPDQG